LPLQQKRPHETERNGRGDEQERIANRA
jgi:hypothetical protein